MITWYGLPFFSISSSLDARSHFWFISVDRFMRSNSNNKMVIIIRRPPKLSVEIVWNEMVRGESMLKSQNKFCARPNKSTHLLMMLMRVRARVCVAMNDITSCCTETEGVDSPHSTHRRSKWQRRRSNENEITIVRTLQFAMSPQFSWPQWAGGIKCDEWVCACMRALQISIVIILAVLTTSWLHFI